MENSRFFDENYPRPQLTRGGWLDLCGKWSFCFDYENIGEKNGYHKGFTPQHEIEVPFSYETKAGGIGQTQPCENVWYALKKQLQLTRGKRVLINFEGADYITKLWVNGTFIGRNTGAYHRFTFDVTDALKNGDNLFVVKCEDSFSLEQPRGKQRWKNENYGCWYEQTTGIFKPVWLEFVSPEFIRAVKITPDIYNDKVAFEIDASGAPADYTLQGTAYLEDGAVQVFSAAVGIDSGCVKAELNNLNTDMQLKYWWPNAPKLYDVKLELKNGAGKTVDEVGTYFAMRDVRVKNGQLYINSHPLYLRMILDQGYWKDSGLTAPSAAALKADVEKTLAMGYNGVRKHQKVEDERYLYYADAMGLTVWCEMPSAYTFSDKMTQAFTEQWLKVVKQNYSHPSVIAWTPFNESWGVKNNAVNKAQQAFTQSIYYATKAIDLNRPVISNDGWEHTVSDIVTLHNYEQKADVLRERLSDMDALLSGDFNFSQRAVFADGYGYEGQPIMLTEYGGCAFQRDTAAGWGYGQSVKDEAEFKHRFADLRRAVDDLNISGYCYTQLTDVQQEKNGLLDDNHEFKLSCPLSEIKKLNGAD